MAIQILPTVPKYNFGSELGKTLGQGFQSGSTAALNNIIQMQQEQQKEAIRQKQIGEALTDLPEKPTLQDWMKFAAKAPTGTMNSLSSIIAAQVKGQQEKELQEQKFKSLSDYFGQGQTGEFTGTDLAGQPQTQQPSQITPTQDILKYRALGEDKIADTLEKQNKAIIDKQTEDAAKINYAKAANIDLPEGVDPRTLTMQQLTDLAKPKKVTPPPYIKSKQKEVEKYEKKIRDQGEKADEALAVQIPQAEKAVENLKDQWTITKGAKAQIPKALQGTFLNEDEQTLNTVQKKFIDDSAQFKGIRLTDEKLKWLEGASVSPFKSYEANKKALEMQKNVYSLMQASRDMMDEIIEDESEEGVPPLDLEKRVRVATQKMMADYIEAQPEYKAEAQARETPLKDGFIKVKRRNADGSTSTGQVKKEDYEKRPDIYELLTE